MSVSLLLLPFNCLSCCFVIHSGLYRRHTAFHSTILRWILQVFNQVYDHKANIPYLPIKMPFTVSTSCRHLSQICKVAARSPIQAFITFYQLDIKALAEFSFNRKVRYCSCKHPPLTCWFCELLTLHLLCCPPLRCTAFGHPNVPEFGRPNVHHVSLGVLQENNFTS